MNTIIEITRDHINFRMQLIKLAKSDIIKQYRGAALGWAWALIKPATTIFVFWFAFSVGIRHGNDMDGHPFFIWLIAGFVPWFYMSETITGGAGSIRKYRYLVKRIKYPVDTIPTFVSMSKLLVNLGLQVIMVAIFLLYGYSVDIYYLQFPLLILMSFVFFTSWSLFSAMLGAMSSDFNNLVKAMVQPLFWLSGILYDVNQIPYHWIREAMLYNPVTIIANGYRNMLVYDKWIWESPAEMRNYCIMLLIMMVLAIWAYGKLKKEIPDVL